MSDRDTPPEGGGPDGSPTPDGVSDAVAGGTGTGPSAPGSAPDRSVGHDDILDRITDAFFALDADFRFTYLNDRAERLLDRSREELLGRVIWDEFPEAVETGFPNGLHRAMETGEPVAFEVPHAPSGTYFEARVYPSDTGLTVSLRDVTDRRGRERDLERYETVVERLHDGVFTIDADDRIDFVNSTVVSALGVDREDLIGRPVTDLPGAVDMDPESATDLGHALETVRRGGARQRRFDVEFRDRTGQHRVAETVMVPLGDGEVAGIVRDVTEEREYEHVVSSLHSITPKLLDAGDELEICSVAVHAAGEVLDLRVSGIWLLDDTVNRMDPMAGTAGAYEELGGLPHFPRGEGPVWEAFRQDETRLYEDLSTVEVEAPDPLASMIVVPIGDHGVLMAGETTAGALDGTDLELATILAADTESALDRADREGLLRRSKATLERQNDRLGVVEQVLSEELREQLAVAARAARDAGAGDAVDPLMRARRLADDALELATGEVSVGPRSAVRLCTLVDAAAEVVDGVDVAVERDGRLRADRDRAVRLFETLLLDARGRADGRVAVGVAATPDGRVVVGDDAADLPPGDREEAFDIRAADAGDGPPGLGLTIAREVAAAHGWEMALADGDDDDGDPDLPPVAAAQLPPGAGDFGEGQDSDPLPSGVEPRFEVREVTTLEPVRGGDDAVEDGSDDGPEADPGEDPGAGVDDDSGGGTAPGDHGDDSGTGGGGEAGTEAGSDGTADPWVAPPVSGGDTGDGGDDGGSGADLDYEELPTYDPVSGGDG